MAQFFFFPPTQDSDTITTSHNSHLPRLWQPVSDPNMFWQPASWTSTGCGGIFFFFFLWRLNSVIVAGRKVEAKATSTGCRSSKTVFYYQSVPYFQDQSIRRTKKTKHIPEGQRTCLVTTAIWGALVLTFFSILCEIKEVLIVPGLLYTQNFLFSLNQPVQTGFLLWIFRSWLKARL